MFVSKLGRLKSIGGLLAALHVGVLLNVGGCSSIDVLNAIADGARPTPSNISYGPSNRQRLDVYRATTSMRPNPVVVFFYGGSWRGGERGDYRFVADALTSAGVAVVIPDYRVYPEVTFPTFIEDAAQAVRWARDHAAEFGGDPNRLFVMGHSSGAHLAAMLAVDRHYLDQAGVPRAALLGFIGLAGPYDFKLRAQDLPVFNLTSSTQPTAAAQPVTYVDGTAPPMLLLQGAKDDLVDPNNAGLLADAVHTRGGDATVISYSKQGHVSLILSLARGFRWLAPTRADVIAFIDAQVASTATSQPTSGPRSTRP